MLMSSVEGNATIGTGACEFHYYDTLEARAAGGLRHADDPDSTVTLPGPIDLSAAG